MAPGSGMRSRLSEDGNMLCSFGTELVTRNLCTQTCAEQAARNTI
eukprot:CAMPEP_0204215672 /NCGR_PEP_ID=MMETSP0361-20130328/77609_1 /ASSEMBLY_ACC=CAM_ASM_000343 /TAXON_ID=268821 /ORGANISM="Scrippsiella Hangoei, Strain SHTV-5" /LENGTH=44 /DNA_ID= /DNA_START= /DNA_END= /DNA_ORIENTATION=